MILAADVRLTASQTFDARAAGLTVGRFVLHPSIAFEYGQDSNIFARSEDLGGANIVSSGIIQVRPRLLADLPLGESRVRLLYSLQYRDYTTDRYKEPQQLSNFFDLEAIYRNGRGLMFALRDHYVSATQEVQQFDQGGELTFGTIPFRLHQPSIEATLDLGARQGVSLLSHYSSLSFKDDPQSGIFGYRKIDVEGRYNYRLTPSASMYTYYSSETTQQERGGINAENFDVASRIAGIGLQRSLNQSIVASFTAGYQDLIFDRQTGENYHGAMLETSAGWTLSDVTRLQITVRRRAYQSFYLNSNYYLNGEIGARMQRQLGRNLYLDTGVTVQSNDYPEPLDVRVQPDTPPGSDADGNGIIDAFQSFLPSQGLRRKDRMVNFQVGMGFQIRQMLRTVIGYTFERRRSNVTESVSGGLIDPFDYSVNRFTLTIEAGWM